MKTETITIEAGKIKPNPFKKFINKGKLDNETISKLIEGYKQTTFHENLTGRRNKKGEVELIYGHHRLEAVKRVYGNNHKITIKVYDYNFSDEKMLIDMIRENLTHRGDDYKDLADSVMLAKKWLESNKTGVKELDTCGRKKHQNETQGIGVRQIADFLSKQGKTISHTTIEKVLGIEENLDDEVKKSVSSKLGRGTIDEGKIGTELAYKLSSITNKKEQKDLLKISKRKKEDLSEEKTIKLLTHYKQSPKDIQDKVRKGKLDLEEVPIENLKAEIKQKKEENKDNSKILVTEYKKYLREAGNRIGDTNTKIFQTCAYLEGLHSSGILYELDWQEMNTILEEAIKFGNNYTKFANEILKRL